ncbi:glycosyltransferase family 4 protein [Georgenia alba]|uniref:Glycosyltransferase family 4 protein n=1 Tax=Georgenia alba TaxID=2233858 RepID=A0ABW2QDN5_9MICO
MRVLQVAGSSTGGVGRHVRDIGAMLAEDHTVLLAAPEDVVAQVNSVNSTAQADGAALRTAVVDITDRPRPQDALAVADLRRLATGADVVHAHGLRAGALAAMAVRTLPGRPRLVVTLHNLPVGSRTVETIAAGLERVVAGGADVVLGVSGDLVDRMRERGARRTARALVPAPVRRPSGSDPARVRESLGVAAGERLVLTVARLAPQKGLDLLLAAAAILAGPRAAGRQGRHASGSQGWRWAVVGDGPLRSQLAGRAGVENLPVMLTGHRDDVPDLLAAADVVVSTATWEGQPLWLQEALAAGAAIVATDVGGTREVLDDAAVLVPGDDAPALAEAVRGVLADPDRQDALREAARRRAELLPTPAEVRAQLEEIYRT